MDTRYTGPCLTQTSGEVKNLKHERRNEGRSLDLTTKDAIKYAKANEALLGCLL